MLRYENNTAFDHSLWDRFEFLSLLEKNDWLKNRDYQHRVQNKYSIVQDGFYSLLNCQPYYHSENKTLLFWNHVVDKPWFKKLQTAFRDGVVGQVISLRKLTLIIESGLVDEEEPEEMIPLVGGNGEDQDQEDQQDQEQENNDDGMDESVSQQDQDSEKGSGESGNDPQEKSDQGDQQGQEGQTQENPGDSVDDQDSQDQGGESKMDLKDIGPQGKFPNFTLDMETAAQQAAEDIQGEVETVKAFSPYTGKEKIKDQIEEAMEISASFDTKRLGKFLGFVKSAVKAVHRSGDAVSGNLTGYKNVEWAENLHPTDMIGVATGDLRTLARAGEGSLRARRYENKKPMGRGPVIFLRDETSSIRPFLQQTRELEFSMAVAFNAEKRDLISIAWNNHQTRTHVYGEGSPKHHLREFLRGNTAVYHALIEGIDYANEYVKGADLVVLTDGEIMHETPDSLQEEKIREYKERGGRIWVITVGRPDDPNVPWADGKIDMDDIDKSDALANLLTEVNRRELLGGRKRL